MWMMACSNPKHAVRRSLVGLTLAGLIGGGCDCGDDGMVDTSPTQTSVTGFVFPTDAATITSQDDVSSAEGIQVNVVVEVANAEGQRFNLTNNVDVDSSGAPRAVEAVAAENQVVFEGYTLPQGDAIDLVVALSNQSCNADNAGANTQCATVRVRVVESFCEFFSPTRDQLLAEDQYPGDASDVADPFETDVLVDCAGIADTDNVALQINGGVPIVAQPAPNQTTVFKRVTFSRVALAEGENSLTVTPKTDAAGANGTGTPETITVRVDTGRCVVSLEPMDGSSILFDSDVDQNPENGMQATIDVTTNCADTSTVELFIRRPDTEFVALTPNEAPTASSVLEGTEFRFPSVTLPESVVANDVIVLATVTEPSGGRDGASLAANYWVDTFVPTIRTVTPGALDCFGVSRDVDSDLAGIQVNGDGTVRGAQDGSEVWIRAFNEMTPSIECTDANAAEVCAAGESCREGLCRIVTTVDADVFTFAALTLPDGIATIEYIALDAPGNRSVPLEVEVEVATLGPSVTITAPSAGALGPADDLDPGTVNTQVTGQVLITNPETADAGTLSVSGVATVFDPADAVDGLVNINIELPDGNQTIVASVADRCGDPVTDSIVVSVQSIPPVISVTAYEVGGFADRNAVFANGATASTAVDLDIAVGEAAEERTVRVTTSPEFDSVNDECTGTSSDVATTTIAIGDNGVLVNASLSAGVNCFTVTSSDSFGEVSRTYVVNQVSAAPTLSFAETSPFSPPADPDGDFNATFNLNFSETLLTRGVLTLTVGADATAPYAVYVTDVAAGLSSSVFGAVSIPTGNYRVDAVFVDSAGNTSNVATLDVEVAGASTGIAITSPRAGEIVVPSAGQVTVELVQVIEFTENSCSVTVNEGTPQPVTFAAGAASVAVPVAEGEVLLEATCDDSGTTRTANDVTFFARPSAPEAPSFVDEGEGTPGRVLYSAPSFVNLQTLDQSEADGFQRDVLVQVPTGGARPDGWMVQMTVNGVDGVDRVFTRPVEPGDPATVLFPAVDFGMGDGEVALSLVVMDGVPRDSSPATATVTVDRTAPTLALTSPPPKDNSTLTVFTRADDEDPFDLTSIELSWTYAADDGQEYNLVIVPAPQDLDPAGASADAVGAGGSVTLGPFQFVDGEGFSAVASAVDPAGNRSEVRFDNFNVFSLTPGAEFRIPRPPRTLDANDDAVPATMDFDTGFRVDTTGIAPGATVRVCSTVAAPGAGSTPCQFGFSSGFDPGMADDITGATLGGPVLQGFVIAEGTLSGNLEFGTLFIPSTPVAQGDQWFHFEVEEPDLTPQVASEFLRFTIDSVRPIVTSLTFPEDDDASLSELDQTDGTVDSGTLLTTGRVTVDGAEDGQTVQVRSNLGGGTTVVGSGALTGGAVDVPLTLLGGPQLLSVVVTDEAGNQNDTATDPSGVVGVVVDFTPPTLTVPEPALAVYSSLNGSVDDGGTAGDETDDRLILDSAVAVTVSVNDDVGLGSADCMGTPRRSCLVVQAWGDSARSGSVSGELVIPLSDGVTSVPAAALPLAQGENFLRGVLTDSVGNATTFDPSNAYVVDFQGPDLVIQFSDGGSALPCTDFASACTPVMSGSGARQWFDPQDDIEYSVASCGSPCSSTLVLESRVVDSTNMGGPSDTRLFSPVSGASIPITMDTTGFASVTANTTNPLFDAGQVREVRLVTTDANGNESISNSLFLALGIDGVIIEVEQLAVDGMTPTGDVLEDGAIFGVADNTSGTSDFTTNFRVTVTETTQEPANVSLNGVSASLTETSLGSGIWVADYLGVPLVRSPASGPDEINTVSVLVNCVLGMSTTGCGERVYEGIIADIDPPRFAYDRCSLCNFDVTFVGEVCNECPGTNDEIEVALGGPDGLVIVDESVATATWNIALDKDNNPDNGFSTSSAEPIRVVVEEVQQAPRVELRSSQGTLVGSELLATGCSGGVCTAVFENLSVPTLANGLVHDITASFVDRAGNAAVAEPGIAGTTEETIFAETDVRRPDSRVPTVCLGESTTPSTVTDPATDPLTFDDPTLCADESSGGVCTDATCSRLPGNVAVTFLAPADDGDTGDRVETYRIHAVPLQVEVDGTTYASCDDVTLDGPFEQTIGPITATADPGGRETVTFSGLNLSRSYCFSVEATDDVGNTSLIESFQRERVLPWLTDVPGQAGIGAVLTFDPGNPDLIQSEAYAFQDTTPSSNMTARVLNLGDMDGDGRDDLAAARSTSTGQAVWLFFSTDDDLSTPSVIIDGPTTGNPRFGWALAAGDIDDDGLNDLAISAREKDAVGAIYVWWGVAGVGIRRDLAQSALRGDLPSVNPDFWIQGAGGNNRFGASIAIADLDEDPGVVDDANEGAELVFSSLQTDRTNVWGYSGGDRERFGWVGAGNPPVALVVDSSALYTGAVGEDRGRPNFRINPNPGGGANDGARLAGADTDADGVSELLVGVRAQDHDTIDTCNNCGEFYVFDGLGNGTNFLFESGSAIGNDGEVQAFGELSSVHRYRDRGSFSENFGGTFGVLENPNGDGADWVLAAVSAASEVVVFAGATSGLSQAGSPPGGFATTGTPFAPYTVLTPSGAGDVQAERFGTAICTRDDEGSGFQDVFIVARPTSTATLGGAFQFVVESGELVQRNVAPGRQRFGLECGGLGSYLPDTSGYLFGVQTDAAGIVIR